MKYLLPAYQRSTKSFLWMAVVVGVIAIGYLISCYSARKVEESDSISLILDWNKYILLAERETEGYRGPVSSRTYGYVGLAAFEAALPALAGDYQSFASRFSGLVLPEPPATDRFEVRVSLNACYATLLRKFFMTGSAGAKQELNRIQSHWDVILAQEIDSSIVKTSRTFGEQVAEAIYKWSATDSLGYMANHHNYDRNFVIPQGDGMWVTSTDFPMPALLPYWGKVRPFIAQSENFEAQPLPPYSGKTNQTYYVQALEIISLSKPVSAENQLIADFWNDDHPGLTFTPPGHWFSITNQVIQKERPSLEKTLETYLRVGFSLADVMIAVWHSKYIYFFERPESFIRKFIDPAWRPLAPSPSFPSYPSGHAAMGAATAEVLTAMYGDGYKMTDRSHEGLPEFAMKPRQFNSFYEMARENALSRIILGVHWRKDAEEGMRIGSLIGKEMVNLKIENKLTE